MQVPLKGSIDVVSTTLSELVASSNAIHDPSLILTFMSLP
jgi:hypothetical protein